MLHIFAHQQILVGHYALYGAHEIMVAEVDGNLLQMLLDVGRRGGNHQSVGMHARIVYVGRELNSAGIEHHIRQIHGVVARL